MIADLLMKVAKQGQPQDDEYRPRPSGWGRCIRASVYHALGYPPAPWSGRFVILLEDSSFGEDLTIDWINRTAYKVHSQQLRVEIGETAGGAPIGGSIDGIIEDILGGEILFDHKAINSYAFERIEGSLEAGVWDETVVKYVHQGVAYLKGIGRLSDINRFMLLCKNKNTSAYLEILGKYDHEKDDFIVLHALSTRISEKSDEGIIGQIDGAKEMILPGVFKSFMDYFNHVEEYVGRKELPQRPYSMDSWQCGYCRWQGECWKEYEKEVEAMVEGAEMPEEIEKEAEEYRALTNTAKMCEDRKKELKSILLNVLTAENIKKCKSSKTGISVSLSVRSRDSLDADLIPAAIREKATKTSTWQQIDVRRGKK